MADWTAIAAWWGMSLSTASVAWQVIQWRKQVPLSIATFPDTPAQSTSPGVSDKNVVLIHVTNVGSQAVSLRGLYVRHFPSWPALLLGKHTAQGMVRTGKSMEPLPRRLKPGEFWEGWLQQDEDVDAWLNQGHLVLEAVHSLSSRPARHTVRRGST